MPRQSRVLLLSGNPAQLDMIARQAPQDRFECVTTSDIEESLDLLEDEPFDVFVVDEDLQGVSGVDVLIQARELEPHTTFVLVVDDDLAIAVAADALNQADISRILLSPYELDEWVECCEDASLRYEKDVRTLRRLNLSRAKVRRLSRSVEQAKRDLRKKTRQIEQMRKAPVTPAPMRPLPVQDPEQEQKLHAQISELLTRVLLASPRGPRLTQLRTWTERCARKLGWSADEARLIGEAALYHHALLGEFPNEGRDDLRPSKFKHAAAMEGLLQKLPGFATIAQLVGAHHPRTDSKVGAELSAQTQRGAKLLQVISLFDELLHDPEMQEPPPGVNDPDYALNRSTDTMLRLAREEKLDPELTQRCLKHFLPRLMDRDETCLRPSELEVGMQLSRCLYADNLVLLPALETLSEDTLEQIQYADETQRFAGVWVMGRIPPTAAKSA